MCATRELVSFNNRCFSGGDMVVSWRHRLFLSGCLWGCFLTSGRADPTARMSASGEALELEYQSGGRTYTDMIPFYRSGRARYFSAGIGVEERAASYPPFPLKLVFTAGGKPYVAQVALLVQAADGSLELAIPRDHITGPWLFLDLPDGFYNIAATMEDRASR
jgi:hypothetical protein